MVLNFTREQDGYFLFFISRISIITSTVVSMIMNSSYVLISIILSVRLRADEKHVPGYPVKYVILFDFVIYFAIIYLTRQPSDRLSLSVR